MAAPIKRPDTLLFHYGTNAALKKSYVARNKDILVYELAIIIRDKEISIDELASMTNMNKHILYNWFFGSIMEPKIKNIRKVSRVLGYDISIRPSIGHNYAPVSRLQPIMHAKRYNKKKK